MLDFFIFILVTGIGAYVGAEAERRKWAHNADRPETCRYAKQFYKVVRLADPYSAKMLQTHEEDIWKTYRQS
jgi:hypothetical protein